MSLESFSVKEPKPRQTVFDRVINAIKDPRLPRKAALILASLLVAASVTASSGTRPLFPMPSEASFSPSSIPTQAETSSPTVEPNPTSTPTLEPALTTSPTLTSAPTETIKPETPTKTPDTFTVTQEMINYVDEFNKYYREKHGLPELTFDKKLAEIAAWHARDLEKTGINNHIDSLGRGLTERDTQMGLRDWQRAGEDLAYGPAENLDDVIDAWENSPSHKAIMDGTWTKVAIGYYYDNVTGLHYWTLQVMLDSNYVPPAPTPKPTLSPTEQPTPSPTSESTPTPTSVITPVPTLSPEPTVAYDPFSPTVLVYDTRRRLIEDNGKLPKAA